MSLIIIIATIWGISALISHIRQARLAEEQKRQREAQARLLREQRAYAQAQREETARLIAIEREQLRQRKEAERERKERERIEKAQADAERKQAEAWEKQRKEDERRDAQLAKHEKRLADLEERMAVAEGEIEFQSQQIERLREHIEHAETERDACVYGSSRYYQWDKKCLALEKQIHTAESKMAKAQYIKTSAAKELAA